MMNISSAFAVKCIGF